MQTFGGKRFEYLCNCCYRSPDLLWKDQPCPWHSPSFIFVDVSVLCFSEFYVMTKQPKIKAWTEFLTTAWCLILYKGRLKKSSWYCCEMFFPPCSLAGRWLNFCHCSLWTREMVHQLLRSEGQKLFSPSQTIIVLKSSCVLTVFLCV